MKKIFRKAFVFPLLLVFLFVVVLFILQYNSFVLSVKSLKVPAIPRQIKEYMDAKKVPLGGFNSNFDWFTFYSPELKTKVKVKYSGLNWGNHDSLLNRTTSYDFNGDNYRLKALASEIASFSGSYGKVFDNPLELIFSEYAAYTIARQFTKWVPTADLVYLNDDKNNLMILWNDEFPNVVREQESIPWTALVKNYNFANGSQSRYFDTVWKTRSDKTKNGLKEPFIKLLNPILAAVTREITKDVNIGFDLQEYYEYLALASVLSSSHMGDHNLVYSAEEKNGDIVSWHPIIYDLMGNWTTRAQNISPFYNLNYISEFLYRNPKHFYHYLTTLYRVKNDVLGGHAISKFYKKLSCAMVMEYPNFSDILLMTGTSWQLPNDINEYCLAISKINNYENLRRMYLDEQLDNATLHWNILDSGGNSKEIIMAIWTSAPIPSRVEGILCGLFDCTTKWELTNTPWWEYDSKIISSVMVRKNRTTFVPTPYIYLYKWTGEKAPDVSKITLKVSNAVTDRKLYAVRYPYPILNVTVTSNVVKLNILNFVGAKVRWNITDGISSNTSVEGIDWRVDVSTTTCKKNDSEFPEYAIDCSEVDLKTWPYPLDYAIELYYKKVRIYKMYGELFQEYTPKLLPDAKELSQKNIANFRVASKEDFKKIGAYERSVADITNKTKQTLFNNLVSKQKDYYFIPANHHYELTSDLDLENAVLLIDKNTTLTMWPLTKIKANIIIAAGSVDGVEERVIFEGREFLPGWSDIEVGEAGYFKGIKVRDSINKEQGAIHGEDLIFLGFNNVQFANDKSNIHCKNCVLDIGHSEGEWGAHFNGGEWAVKTSDSAVNVRDINCSNTIYCFDVSDTRMTMDGVYASGTQAWVFNVIGGASDLKVDRLTLTETDRDKVNTLFYIQGSPKISYDLSSLHQSQFNVREANMDSEEIYVGLIEATSEDFYREYKKFVSQGDTKNTFVFKENTPVIEEDFIIPKTVKLEFLAGTTVRLEEDVSMLSYGEVVAKGTEKKPILFTSGNNSKNPWGVFVLRGSSASGEFSYTRFENGGSAYLAGVEYTGALTAHKAKRLIVRNSIFKKNTGDDGLNCKYTMCTIAQNIFEQNAFDGVDFDFAHPLSSISSNIFLDNGNDAIDVSFDSSKIYGNEIKKSGDKCVSVGEESKSLIVNNLFSRCRIGVEAKDGSTPLLVNNSFIDNNITLNAYQKKMRFTRGSTIKAFNSLFEENKTLSKTDDVSNINIVRGQKNDVYIKYLKEFNVVELKYGTR